MNIFQESRFFIISKVVDDTSKAASRGAHRYKQSCRQMFETNSTNVTFWYKAVKDFMLKRPAFLVTVYVTNF